MQFAFFDMGAWVPALLMAALGTFFACVARGERVVVAVAVLFSLAWWAAGAAFEGHADAADAAIVRSVTAKYDVTLYPNTRVSLASRGGVDVMGKVDGVRANCTLRLLKGDDPVVFCAGGREADRAR